MVGQVECVQVAYGAPFAKRRSLRQPVHMERVSRSVCKSRAAVAAVHRLGLWSGDLCTRGQLARSLIGPLSPLCTGKLPA